MQKILNMITSDPALEARWLNTISLLETIGARKIAKTVCGHGHPERDLLKHQADEARHAILFKELAEDLAGTSEVGYLCEQQAVHYFQSLDQLISKKLAELLGQKNEMANYLFVTALIEQRAMKLYPLYRSLTQNEKIRNALQTVILEEAEHKGPLDQKAEKFLKENNLPTMDKWTNLESELFAGFEKALEDKLYNAA